MATVLIIDDDPDFRESLSETLVDLGHASVPAATAREGLAALDTADFDVVLLDFRLPDGDGVEVLRRLAPAGGPPAMPVIMLTAFASPDNTIEAMKLGAFDHLTKPIGRADLEAVLARAMKHKYVPRGETTLLDQGELLGESAAMRALLKMIGRAVASDATVLITGETGTGKELVARALHQHSTRVDKPFLAVNCAAIPHELLESELFGHVRGAFTGAVAHREGVFVRAQGGTLLLDEVGDMSLLLQAKLLRVLQEREIVPVGGTQELKVDVRVIAATLHDLTGRVASGAFREDLFYRLNVLHLHVPPLRERPEDIMLLAQHFLAQATQPSKRLTPAAQRTLLAYLWPGNVRELKNVLERASILTPGLELDVADLDLPGAAWRTPAVDFLAGTLSEAVARLEEAMIRKALREAAGNRAAAARQLGIHRQLLYSKIKQYDIDD
jgi:two-component system, NtrC family, response regulator